MSNQIRVGMVRIGRSVFLYLTIAGFITFAVMYCVKMIQDRVFFTGEEALMGTFADTSLLFIVSTFTSHIIGSDFTNRTVDNEIRIGYSRLSVVLSRAAVVLPLTFAPYLAYCLCCAAAMSAVNGFGTVFTAADILVRLLLFFLQVASIQSFTLFIMFACKKASLGMLLNICFAVLTCNLLRNFLDSNAIFNLTSFGRIMMNDRVMTVRELSVSFVSAAVTLAVMVTATWLVFRRTELK